MLQLGTLALIPYAGQLMLETGVIRTVLTLFQQIATGEFGTRSGQGFSWVHHLCMG